MLMWLKCRMRSLLFEVLYSGYIQIPRGLQDELIANIDKAGIEYSVDDERQLGRNINVELRPEQDKALKEIIKFDNGILHAATAFGKTVVCSAMIAEKKVNTLIILESSALIEQWQDALNKFLIIDEELPQYKTKTGRLRTRKSLIGTLQGAHDSMTGIIDIAMGMCGYDRVIVEPSGIYDVDEFFDVLHDEPLDKWYEIGNVITIVDAKLEEELSKEADYLLASEAANVGSIILSRAEEATNEEIEKTICHLNRALEQVQCKRKLAQEIYRKDGAELTDHDFDKILISGYVAENYQKMDLREGFERRICFALFHGAEGFG